MKTIREKKQKETNTIKRMEKRKRQNGGKEKETKGYKR